MILGFSGTQYGMTDLQREAFLRVIDWREVAEFHHGDCIGADSDAHDIVLDIGNIPIYIHPPILSGKRAFCNFAKYRFEEKPYLARNKDIVDMCHLLVACPKGLKEELRSGTWATIRYAQKMGKPVVILAP